MKLIHRLKKDLGIFRNSYTSIGWKMESDGVIKIYEKLLAEVNKLKPDESDSNLGRLLIEEIETLDRIAPANDLRKFLTKILIDLSINSVFTVDFKIGNISIEKLENEIKEHQEEIRVLKFENQNLLEKLDDIDKRNEFDKQGLKEHYQFTIEQLKKELAEKEEKSQVQLNLQKKEIEKNHQMEVDYLSERSEIAQKDYETRISYLRGGLLFGAVSSTQNLEHAQKLNSLLGENLSFFNEVQPYRRNPNPASPRFNNNQNN